VKLVGTSRLDFLEKQRNRKVWRGHCFLIADPSRVIVA
jgi:hypothetical protein